MFPFTLAARPEQIEIRQSISPKVHVRLGLLQDMA
jgi:hypothetical protein